MGPEFETPAGQEKNHRIVKLLQTYAEQVRDQGFLARSPKQPYPFVNAANQKLTFVGSNACQGCHQAEFAVWKKSGHSHAYDALVNKATKPTLRQFDPECIRCHVVGFDFTSGYVDQKTTPLLKDVGCENCHGPGSGHVQQPMNPQFRADLSAWKVPGGQQLLPTAERLKVGMEKLNAAEQKIVMNVNDKCQKCHDMDNDPHFKIDEYWPKIFHRQSAKRQGE
jgi:Cytochrome c554 and c-prime